MAIPLHAISNVTGKTLQFFPAAKADGTFRCYQYYRRKLTSAQVNRQPRGEGSGSQDYTLAFKTSARALDDRVRYTFDNPDAALTFITDIKHLSFRGKQTVPQGNLFTV
jgi:hypothetical protein